MRFAVVFLLALAIGASSACGRESASSSGTTCFAGVTRLRSCLAAQPDCKALEPILWEACEATQQGDDGAYAVGQCEQDTTASEIYAYIAYCELDERSCSCVSEHDPVHSPAAPAGQQVSSLTQAYSQGNVSSTEQAYYGSWYYPRGFYNWRNRASFFFPERDFLFVNPWFNVNPWVYRYPRSSYAFSEFNFSPAGFSYRSNGYYGYPGGYYWNSFNYSFYPRGFSFFGF